MFTKEVNSTARAPAAPRSTSTSPPQNHLLPEEALGGLVVVDQRLSLAEAVPLALVEPVHVRHAVSPQALHNALGLLGRHHLIRAALEDG